MKKIVMFFAVAMVLVAGDVFSREEIWRIVESSDSNPICGEKRIALMIEDAVDVSMEYAFIACIPKTEERIFLKYFQVKKVKDLAGKSFFKDPKAPSRLKEITKGIENERKAFHQNRKNELQKKSI